MKKVLNYFTLKPIIVQPFVRIEISYIFVFFFILLEFALIEKITFVKPNFFQIIFIISFLENFLTILTILESKAHYCPLSLHSRVSFNLYKSSLMIWPLISKESLMYTKIE
uniref:Uncharacterized protein n=1 Tax=Cacopsylla melanoneura TaxID=428564 RepID=A0A8D8MAR5_9HEMI